MPKDAKGHGSNPRGGGSYSNIDKNLRGPGKHVGYADGAWRIVKSGAGYQATHQASGEMLFSSNLGQMSSKLADRAAASQLASGPKSAPAPVHEAMTEHGVSYQPGVTGGALSLHKAYGTDWKKHDKKGR